MKDRTGWTRGETGATRIGTKTYKRLVEFSRPCVTCQKLFSIFVTEKIAEGLADSNNFGLKNCEQHRRGGGAPIAELETLRSKDRVMSDELAALHETIRNLRERLAKYELQPAMERMSTGEKMPWQ